VVTLPVRVPYWGEAEVVFEASRLRRGLPLYVDPLVGAHEYGEPPSRFYVTYPPIWAWVVSRVPDGAALVFARITSTAAWFGSLAVLAVRARRESRAEAILAAAFVAGIWVLANFATVGRPDSLACAIAAVALERSIRKGRVDDLSVALFVLVPWVKPTLLGVPTFAILGGALADKQRAKRVIGFAILLAGASAVIAFVGSGGAIFAHVVRSNAQPFASEAWLGQVPSRLPFFAPLFVWAGWVGLRDRAAPGARIGLAALGGGIGWTLFALAKTGSSSNYWMEPCIAAVALIARASPAPFRFGHGPPTHALAALLAVVWADVASVSAALHHAALERADAMFVASVRRRCGVDEGSVIAADEAGIELVANGRLLTPTYQMVHLVRSGAYPSRPWISDLASSRCFVEHTGQLRLVPELQRGLEESFFAGEEQAGFLLWRHR
jgi:hypothetical protein